jgi:2-keto-3-deoxy-L-rhamnonate aldolase RhmA
VAAVDELAQVYGLDALLIGPNDIGYNMTGTRGAMTAEVENAIDYVSVRLRAAGKPFGMPCTIADIPRFKARGANIVYYTVGWLLERALAELSRELRSNKNSNA